MPQLLPPVSHSTLRQQSTIHQSINQVYYRISAPYLAEFLPGQSQNYDRRKSARNKIEKSWLTLLHHCEGGKGHQEPDAISYNKKSNYPYSAEMSYLVLVLECNSICYLSTCT